MKKNYDYFHVTVNHPFYSILTVLILIYFLKTIDFSVRQRTISNKLINK